jgi:hypothetical protein
MVKSFQNYFSVNEDAATELVTLNQQEAEAMKVVNDAQIKLTAIREKIKATTAKQAEEQKLAAAQAPTV